MSLATAVLTTVIAAGSMSPALAHGIGGRLDLPVPLSYFVIGAGIVVVGSFVAVSVLWRRPRLQGGPQSKPLGRTTTLPGTLPGKPSGAFRYGFLALQAVGLAGLGLVLVGGFFDGNDSTRNVGPVLVWVYFWLVIPFFGAVIGDWWRAISPWRLIGSWSARNQQDRPDIAAMIGMWPATIGFVAFTWLELVSSGTADPATLATAAVIYTVYVIAITRWLGLESGLASGGVFENYNRLISSIASIGVDHSPRGVGTANARLDQPRLVIRGWLRALPAIPLRRGLAAFVVAMLGTVTYDGMSSTAWWGDLVGDLLREQWFETLALIGAVAVMGAAYWSASFAAGKLAYSPRKASEIAASFAHTLIPIALAYAFAHYFTLIIFEGQILLHAASDPFGYGWDLFGTASWRVVFWLSPTVIWYVQLATIVTGHVLGVMLAHDRALHEFEGEIAVRTQYAMLGLMVALTSFGLLILAG